MTKQVLVNIECDKVYYLGFEFLGEMRSVLDLYSYICELLMSDSEIAYT